MHMGAEEEELEEEVHGVDMTEDTPVLGVLMDGEEELEQGRGDVLVEVKGVSDEMDVKTPEDEMESAKPEAEVSVEVKGVSDEIDVEVSNDEGEAIDAERKGSLQGEAMDCAGEVSVEVNDVSDEIDVKAPMDSEQSILAGGPAIILKLFAAEAGHSWNNESFLHGYSELLGVGRCGLSVRRVSEKFACWNVD